MSLAGDAGMPAVASHTEREAEEFGRRRAKVVENMRDAVPMWMRCLCEELTAAGPSMEEGVGEYAVARTEVECQVEMDRVRALLPMFLNTPVQDTEELLRLVELAIPFCADGAAAEAMVQAKSLVLGVMLDTRRTDGDLLT
eukprot:scaffold45226_cov53-Prasinocladus_malaysianus.AAC.1